MLEKEGLITKKVETNEREQTRKVYSITNEGTKKLRNWLMESAKPETFKFEVLLKINFGDQIPKEQIIKHIEELKTRNAAQLENILSIEKEMKTHTNDSDRLFFSLLTLSLGKCLHQAASEWVDTTIKLIEQHKQKGASKA